MPIIVLTGRDDTRRQAIFDDAGADDLIMKPLSFEEVEVRVRTMLKKREVFRALERANVELRAANERMQRLVQRDERTELFNFRHFMDRLGEEFSVLLPNTTAAQGQRLAERVRKSTEGHPFEVPNGGGPAQVTVSAGVATFPINDRIAEPPDLVQAADDALYRAKGMGRNRSHVDEKSLVAFL